MHRLRDIFLNKGARVRAYARGLELVEAMLENTRALPAYTALSRFNNRAQAELSFSDHEALTTQIRNVANQLKKAHVAKCEDRLSVAVTVGRGMKAHVHEFHSKYDRDTNVLNMSFYDPEGYVGRRHFWSPQTTQWLISEVNFNEDQNAPNAISMSFARVSVAGKRKDHEFRRMHQIQARAREFDQSSKTGVVVYYGLDADGRSAKISSDHALKRLNEVARFAQVQRTLDYISTLERTNHLRPLNVDGRIYRHCEPGATCTPKIRSIRC